MSAPAFTPGPWRWELSRHSKRIELCGGPRFDHTAVSFERYGMGGAAPTFWSWENNLGNPQRADKLAAAVPGREHHADWFADVDHPTARLIAAAPELYEVARLWSEYDALLRKYAGPQTILFDGDAPEVDAAYDRARDATFAALAKARGEQ